MSLINNITLLEIDKIFPNTNIKRRYLSILSEATGIVFDNIRTINAVNNAIIDSWNYELSKQIIRDLFIETEKYLNNRNSGHKLEELMDEWQNLGLGNFEWPFLPIRFDQHVHILNRRNLTEAEKDRILSKETIKYRRIKDINAQRNDYIEYLIFENNANIIPTLKNAKGVDFYINGEPYDQKVARSVGANFIEEYGNNYKNVAINNPHLVAKNLYESQDEARFGHEARLLIVYLDSDLTLTDIENSLHAVDFDNPLEIEFSYTFSTGETNIFSANCFVILLHK